MKVKKLIGLLLACVMLVAVFSACTGTAGDTSSASSAASSKPASSDEQKQEVKENVTIRIMSWHGEESNTLFYKGFKEAADDYTALNPNVTFEFVFQPLDGYTQLLDTQFIAKSAPEIIHMQPRMNNDYANKGMLYNLDVVMNSKSPYSSEEKWIDSFEGGSAAFSALRSGNMYGAIFAVPNDENPMLAIGQPYAYNKDLFKAAGLDPEKKPETWAEYVEILKALKESGVIPFAADNDRWIGWSLGNIGGQFGEKYLDKLYDAKYNDDPVSALFQDKGRIALANGLVSDVDYYNDVLDIWKDYTKYWQDGWTGTSYEESVNLFFMQKAAIMQIGSWDHSTFKDTIGDTFEWSVFPVPRIDSATSQYASGKFNSAKGQQSAYGFAINKAVEGTGALEAAVIDFMQYFSSVDAQNKYVQTSVSYSPIKGVKIPDELMSYANPSDKSTASQMLSIIYVEWGDGAIWKGLAQDLLTGKIDNKKFIAECTALSKKSSTDYCDNLLKPEGYEQQIADAEQKLSDFKANGAAEDVLAAQQKAIDNLKLRQEMMNQYYKK